MAHWLRQTNQSLYHARLLLDDSESVSDKQKSQALVRAGLHLTHDAWLSYLNELGEGVGLQQEIVSFEHLFQATPLLTGEMLEIKRLFEQSDWLVSFLTQVQSQHSVTASSAQAAPASLIATSQALSYKERDWWQALSDLIDSQRANRLES